MKDSITMPTPETSDVGQLLFYMLGIFVINSEKNEQQQMGLYIEGEHVSYYVDDHIYIFAFALGIDLLWNIQMS